VSAPAFDAHHPPEATLIADCVHCGFCLPACPTYRLWGKEMDSPRGRIYLMKVGLEGEPLNATMARHFDLCLGCLGCVTACPSGVEYGSLLEATRQQVDRRHRRPHRDRMWRGLLFALLPYPARLRWLRPALWLYRALGLRALFRSTGLVRLLPRRLRALESLQPELDRADEVLPRTPAQGDERRRVGLLSGCVQRVFFPRVNAATVRVLAAEGCQVLVPEAQGCCGALSLHAGREAEAKAFARRTIDVFERAEVDHVVTNAAGCGSALKEYPRLLRDDPAYAERARGFATRVRDVSELVTEIGPAAPRHPLPVVVAYHDACHLSHAQGIRSQPRQLLRAIPGLELCEIEDADLCCGSAGIYNLTEPEAARELGDRKAGQVLATEAQVLVTSNPGCVLQIGAGLERLGRALPLVHLVEVLDASLRGSGRVEGP
jgi:glycolate oxidase iron-sulfur subunit